MSNATIHTTESRLRVHRMIAQYLVDRDHPEPERVKQMLDGAISTGLADRLATLIGSLLPGSDPGVWKIRRLRADLDLEIDTGRDSDPDAIRDAFAYCVARELLRAIAEGPDDEGVVRFPDRPTFLAGYLEERAEGLNLSWYYETFEGLRLLPTSSAIRTAVLDDPVVGLAAMKSLGPDRLKRVLSALTERDAERILENLADSDTPGNPAACEQAVERVGNRPSPTSPAAVAIFLYIQAHFPVHRAGPPLRHAAVAAAQRKPETTSLGRNVLLSVENSEPSLTPSRRRMEPRRDSVALDRRATPFGGAFLLLPILDALPIPDATRGWPNAEGTAAAELVRFLILVQCLGHPAIFDPLLRQLMGISADLRDWEILEWQSFLSRSNRSDFLDNLDRWSFDRGAIALETQSLIRVGEKAILLDNARGQWRRIFSVIEARSGRISRQLVPFLLEVPRGGRLLCDQEYFQALIEEFSGNPEKESEVALEVNNALGAVNSGYDELQFFDLGPLKVLSNATDRTFTTVAQGVLRAFAWGLPGFSTSRPAFLRSNFLDFPATLEDQPDRHVVRMGNPPLGVILNMTGKSRDSFELSWLDGTPFTLFPEA